MDRDKGSPFDCGWQDWLFGRKLDPHLIEDGERYGNLQTDQIMEYLHGWSSAKDFYNKGDIQ